MKFTNAFSTFLVVVSIASHAASAADNKKDEHQLRRRIEQHLKDHRRHSVHPEGAAKKIDVERRRAQMMPEGAKGVDWEPGSFTFGTYLRDSNGNRVRVNNGIMGRAIGIKGENVTFADGTVGAPMHSRSDGGGVIAKEDGSGFYYVSNSEDGDLDEKIGGVFVFELDNNHDVIDYYNVLSGTVDNCAGGVTPWGTWVSCEEEDGYGQCWQVDPANKEQTGSTKSEATALTGYLGNWEAFAWDDIGLKGYVTDDAEPEDAPLSYGCLNRFTPDEDALACYAGETKEDRWCTLNSGTIDYLKLYPDAMGSACGTIGWTSEAEDCDSHMYRAGEGIDITDQIMRFSAKTDHLWFEVDLVAETYCTFSTFEGFPQEPDNIRFYENVLYFCTDGRTPNGVYAYDGRGYYSIFQEIDYNTEVAGLDFSPDGKIMYAAFQDAAVWQFWRTDGKRFVRKSNTLYIPEHADFATIQDSDTALENIVKDIITEVLEENGLIES